jgi:hypothetical protein
MMMKWEDELKNSMAGEYLVPCCKHVLTHSPRYSNGKGAERYQSQDEHEMGRLDRGADQEGRGSNRKSHFTPRSMWVELTMDADSGGVGSGKEEEEEEDLRLRQ